MEQRLLLLLLLLPLLVQGGFFDSIFGGSKKKNNRDPSLKPVSDEKARKYLQDFGYVGPSNSLMGAPGGMAADFADAKSLLKQAITKFQEFAGLKKTGELDEVTKVKMAEPRCGMMDAPMALTSGGSSAFKWKKNRVTYSIENFSSDLPKDHVTRALREAYNLWAEQTNLDFAEVPAGQGDIKVRFGVNNHNDPWPFDGKGGVLAHATMPESGLLHFDDDENWAYMDAAKIGSNKYTDFLAVAIHEGGHTLGLEHSRDEASIMAPFYHKTVDDNGNYKPTVLTRGDIQAIQDIYGPRRTPFSGGGSRGGSSSFGGSGSSLGGGGSSFTTPRPTTTTRRGGFGGLLDRLDGLFGRGKQGEVDFPTTTSRPSPSTTATSRWGDSGFGDFGGSFGGFGGRTGGSSFSGGSTSTSNGDQWRGGTGHGDCPRSVDAICPGDSGDVYLFSGSKVYQINNKRVTEVYSLTQLFPGAPRNVQAAVYNPIAMMTMLFSGGQVYGYYYSRLRKRFQMDSEFPKRLTSDVGFLPTGALRWINGHQILMSDNDQFAVYDEYWNQATLKNRISSYFPNLPSGVKGALTSTGSTVTAFTSTQVFEYDTNRKQTGRSQSLGQWMQCS